MLSRYCNTNGSWLYLVVATAACFQWTTPATAAASMVLQPCQLPELARPTQCGVLELPENPDHPQGRQLAISVAVVKAASGKALADPIVLLMGGPGESAIDAAAYFATQFDAFLDERDLLLIDQRGTGRSAPLRCDLFSPAEAAANLQDFLPLVAVKRCTQQFRARADLGQYTYAHLARDIEAIRRALGYGQLNLYSASYGTRAALIYLRMFPHNVRTAYFGSTVPLDETIPVPLAKAAQLAMDKTFAACGADVKCRTSYPDLPTQFREVMARLDAGVNVAVPGHAGTAALSRGRVAEYMRAKLYRAEGAATVPWLIHQAHAGNWAPIVDGILAGVQGRDVEISAGLFFAIACDGDVAFIREQDVVTQTQGTFVGDYRVRQQQAACKEWPKGSLAPDYRVPVHSTVPSLFASGDIDPATPLWFTEKVAKNFPNRIEVVLRNQGHTEWNDCLGDLYGRFVRSGTVRGLESASCAAVPRPPFKTL